MTNIKRKSNQQDVHSHIDKAFIIIDEHLPNVYVDKVLEKLKGKEITSGMIRNVRNRSQSIENRIEVVNALVEVALEHKAEKEKLKKLIA
jgi:3-dehydroquinate synthetase